MGKKKTKSQLFEDNNHRRERATGKKKREELSDFCREYLEKKGLFEWFITKYAGAKKFLELWELAENDQEASLRNELEGLWYQLPDSIFNIRNNPPGWTAFLNLIDE